MKRIGSAMAVAAALAFASPAAAQLAFDLKAGYGMPTGDAVKLGGVEQVSGAMKNFWSGEVPIEVAGRWRFSPSFSAGVYFQYAPAFVAARICPPDGSCSGSDVRVGVEAVYAFRPEGFLNPWVSLGTGWEWSTLSIAIPTDSAKVTCSGWEFFNVQAGLDFNLSKMFAIGPYLGYFGGSFSTVSGTWSGVPQGPTIPSEFRAFHGWFQLGAKGTINL